MNARASSPCDLPLFYSSSSSPVPTLISPSTATPSSTSSLSIKGYPRQILGLAPVEIDPNYLCGHCKELLRDPVQASCGHRFCQICLHKLIKGLCYTFLLPLVNVVMINSLTYEASCLTLAQTKASSNLVIT